MNLNRPNFIEKTPFDDVSEDFDFLLKKGIELLQKLTGNTWTDYNAHDPGVTILEQLCFAFTDLSYRTGFDLKDILSDEDGRISIAKNSFLDKKRILSTNPVTVNDYRKVMLDEVQEIDNVDIVPVHSKYAFSYVKGLYEIRVKLKNHLAEKQKNDPEFAEAIKNRIREVFVSKRNIGENVCRKIVLLHPQTINIEAEILTKELAHPEEVLLEIYLKIQEYLSPQVHFYSERELLEKNTQIEQIYDGPLLKRGILPDSELRNMATEIDIFKLINVVSSANEVLLVKELKIDKQDPNTSRYSFKLNKNSYPILDPYTFIDAVKLYTGEYKHTVSAKTFLELLNKSNSLSHFNQKKSRHEKDTDFMVGGNYINAGAYVSIQEHFPHIYGLGKYGVFANEASERKAKVKQLRAYIFFFEQVLANYVAQLENISNFFSTDLEGDGAHSFYAKPLYDIRGANEIIGGTQDQYEWESFIKNQNNAYIHTLNNKQETISDFRLRKHKTFEHIYARFNELFVKYPIMAYINAYGDNQGSKAGLLLNWKAWILKNFTDTEYHRVHAFNYMEEFPALGGFEKKIMRLLHIKDERKKPFSNNFTLAKTNFVSGKLNDNVNNTTYTIQWENETLEISANSENFADSDELGMSADGKFSHKLSLFFQQEGISVFEYGIHLENYRIVPSPTNESEFIIVYKKSKPGLWKTISTHPDKELAKQALNKLVSYLRTLSIQSEGFHVVEHILLCPPTDSTSFGFRFYTAQDQAPLNNNDWTTFTEREETIAKLLKSAVSYQVNEKNNVQPEYTNQDKPWDLEAKKCYEDLHAFANKQKGTFPYFEMVVKSASGKIVKEEFYNMQLTVVLPSWPARFQDAEFKSFVANLFNSLAPAHLSFNFQWLGLKRMKMFEDAYFPWLESLKNQESQAEKAEELSMLLGFEQFLVTQS